MTDHTALIARLRDIGGTTGLLFMLLAEHRASCSLPRAECPTEQSIPEAQDALRAAALAIENSKCACGVFESELRCAVECDCDCHALWARRAEWKDIATRAEARVVELEKAVDLGARGWTIALSSKVTDESDPVLIEYRRTLALLATPEASE